MDENDVAPDTLVGVGDGVEVGVGAVAPPSSAANLLSNAIIIDSSLLMRSSSALTLPSIAPPTGVGTVVDVAVGVGDPVPDVHVGVGVGEGVPMGVGSGPLLSSVGLGSLAKP